MTLLHGAHLRANGIRQHYLRYGGVGAPMVVLPGIVSPAAVWAPAAERLGARFDTYVLDVRGRGLSEAGPELDYGLDACAADLVAFVRALGLEGCVVLGHSNGARIAARAACVDADAFGRLVLVDPPVSGPGRRPYPSKLEGVLELLRAGRRGEAYDHIRRTSPSWPERDVRLRARWVHTCDERAVVATHEAFHTEDFHADLRRVPVPTALIAAGRGTVILPEDEAELRAMVPGMPLLRVADAGHQIPVENLEGFLEAVGEVLGVRFG